MSGISKLWHSENEQDWKKALDKYWDFVKPNHLEIEHELDELDSNEVEKMDARQWFDFLLNGYFFWKYTAPNRYATTTNQLVRYRESEKSLAQLFTIKRDLFAFDKNDIAMGLKIARKIKGLGTAGASGLLSLLFPGYFATVDQFVVKALLEIPDLPERKALLRMNPEQLSIADGVILIQIMRDKANKLNESFKTEYWTPRKIDKVLWAVR